MKKIAITDYVHPLLLCDLKNLGFEVIYNTQFTNMSLLESIQEFTGIIINSKIEVNKKLFDKADKLQFIARLGSGLDITDLEYANKKI